MPAREIATAQQIPLRFLEQQLGALHKAGLVESFRGAGGGCRLAKEPAEITVAQIADAIEGQLYPMFCLEPTDHTCFADSRCGLQGFWARWRRPSSGSSRRRPWPISRPASPAEPGPTVFTPEQLLSGLN